MESPVFSWGKADSLIEELAKGQHAKLLACGRRIVPVLTEDDLLQPNDFPELETHPEFRYEEGILAGMQTVQMALRAKKNDEC